MSKHLPSNWQSEGDGVSAVVDGERLMILTVHRFAGLIDAETQDAISELAAAAPQLLEALEEAERDLVACRINIRRDLVQRGNTMWEGVPEILDARIKHIRTAIAAAKGEGK